MSVLGSKVKKNDTPPLFNERNSITNYEKIIRAIEQLWQKVLSIGKEVVTIKDYLYGNVKNFLYHLDDVKLENPVDNIQWNLEYNNGNGEGLQHWNADDGLLEYGLPGGNVNLQIGAEMILPRRLQATTGVSIVNGNLVYIVKGTGKLALAKADAFLTSRVSGMATEDIPAAGGWVCADGIVRGDTAQPLDTSAYAVGTSLFLSATTAGAFTDVAPSAPNYKVFIGRVWRSHATEGEIFVRTISTPNLSGLSDVNETAPVDKSILNWNDAQGYYEHTTTPQFGDPTGGDYSEFESDGTLVFNGDSTVWEDINFAVVRSGGPVANRPDDVTINNVYYKEFTNLNNQSCGDSAEIAHAALLTQTYYPHIHVFLKSGESAGATGVTFRIYWELRQGSSTTTGSVDLTATSAQLTANPNRVDLYDATGFTGATTKGAQLAMSLHRISGDAGDVVVTTYGIHLQYDMVGSRTVSTK